mgnify:CR=1 FL=1
MDSILIFVNMFFKPLNGVFRTKTFYIEVDLKYQINHVVAGANTILSIRSKH